jgi:hypothetical protein
MFSGSLGIVSGDLFMNGQGMSVDGGVKFLPGSGVAASLGYKW